MLVWRWMITCFERGDKTARRGGCAATVILYVADKEGFFKKYGANVEIPPFDTGTAAARAVIAGDIDMALSPSALIINQVSNTGVGLVAIYGLVNSDMVLASVDPTNTKAYKRQPRARDASPKRKSNQTW